MKTNLAGPRPEATTVQQQRRGSIIVLSALVFVLAIAFTAFTVDVGYITLTKAQLQRAADASALGSGLELYQGFGIGTALESYAVDSLGRYAATEIAAMHDAGDRDSVYADAQRDVRFGQAVWDETTGSWLLTWGATPYNLVEVALHRAQADASSEVSNISGDGPLPLFFAPLIGHHTADITVTARTALLAGTGFKISPGSTQTAGVLPFAISETTWNDLLNGVGDDNFSFNPDTGAVTSGADGVREASMYPQNYDLGELTPGNFGAVDIGNHGNSTADVIRQLTYGLNADDLSYYGGEFRTDQTPLSLNGDTGISAGMQAALESIIGQSRAISVFSEVYDPGNNATFRIERFVGVRIVDVHLTGHPKSITIQSAVFSDATVIPSDGPITIDSILSPVRLIQ